MQGHSGPHPPLPKVRQLDAAGVLIHAKEQRHVMSTFKYVLNQQVTLTKSTESGEVIGRAEYTHADNNYLIQYQAADGRQVEDWWTETAIQTA